MAIEQGKATRTASFVVVLIGLGAICVGLGVMMFITIDAASTAKDPAVRKFLARLAWLSLLLLSLALLMLVWVVLRHIRNRVRDSLATPSKPTGYVNAWELAGKRFQLNEDNEPDEDDYLPDDEQDDEDDQDEPGPKDRWR